VAAPWLPCSVTLLALVLGVFPIHCIGNPTSEHQMAAMAHASGALPPAVLGSVSFQISCKPRVATPLSRRPPSCATRAVSHLYAVGPFAGRHSFEPRNIRKIGDFLMSSFESLGVTFM
jgi:hypothetical protein